MVRNTDKDAAEAVDSPQAEVVEAAAAPAAARRRRKAVAAQSEPVLAAEQDAPAAVEPGAQETAEPAGAEAATGEASEPEARKPVRRGRKKASSQPEAVAEAAAGDDAAGRAVAGSRTKAGATAGEAPEGEVTAEEDPAEAESSASGTTAEPAAEVPAAAEVPEPAPKRRRRKVEAAAAEPPAAEIPAAEASAVEAAEAEADEAEQPAAAEATAEAPAETAPELSEPSPAPAPKRRRRKVVAAQAAPAPAPEPEVAPAEAALAPEEEAELLEAELLEAEPETSEDSPRLPAASLLFQAPDPARAKRRRRKATAAAQAPQAAPEPEPPASDQAGSDEGEAVTEAAPAPAKRRRRKATAAAQAPQAAPEAEPQPTDADTSETPEAEAAAEGEEQERGTRKRRRGGRGRRSRNRAEEGEASSSAEDAPQEALSEGETSDDDDVEAAEGSSRRRRRRRSRSRAERAESRDVRDEITAPKGSTRLEAKRQRRREGRAAGRRRPIVTEAEFLARRESVERQMIVREQGGLNQIAVLEDGLLVEHYVARRTQTSMVGNVYIGRVQNVLPSMEAAFVDLGKGRNAVLYAGEVNWDAAGMEGRPRRIEEALSNGDTVLVQVTKDPIGHKGARLTSQVTLAGRYLVLVPGGTMTGISRKLPDTERSRLKKILKKVVPDDAGVIVRTAAEGASEEQLSADVQRLLKQWESIDKKAKQVMSGSGKAPVLLKGEPELAVRVVRDVFNEDFKQLIVSGRDAWATISEYVTELSPDLADRLVHWVEPQDVFAAHRVDEQLAKGFDRKVWLPSGGTLVIDRTEAMTVIDVNTGRFTGGAGGTLEETVTRNNLEAAEEIVRQLRLRDIGGMVVIDFVDMVLEANRDLVLRRLVECLGRDRTRHQVTEVTSLGLVQMTRKRVGQGLVEAFSTQCDCCGGRGFIVHDDPVENQAVDMSASASRGAGRGRRSKQEPSSSGARERGTEAGKAAEAAEPVDEASREVARNALAQIAAAAEQAHRS